MFFIPTAAASAPDKTIPQTNPTHLDAIGKAAECAVRPTRATILRQMLVEGMGQIRNSIHIAPMEIVRQMRRCQIRVRQRMDQIRIVTGILTDLQVFLFCFDLF